MLMLALFKYPAIIQCRGPSPVNTFQRRSVTSPCKVSSSSEGYVHYKNFKQQRKQIYCEAEIVQLVEQSSSFSFEMEMKKCARTRVTMK